MTKVADSKDTNPNPSADSPPADDGRSPGQGSPAGGSTSGAADAPEPTLAERISKGVQSVVDQNTAFFRTGRYEDMNPKLLEFAGIIQESLGHARPAPAAEEPSPYSGYRAPAQPARTPDGQPDYSAIGRESVTREAAARATALVEQNQLAELWEADVRDFVETIGEQPLTDEQFATVNFADANLFPRNKDGYNAWRKNYHRLLVSLAKTGGAEEEAAEDTGLEADRTAAGAAKRPPVVASSKKGINTLVDAARAMRKGEMSKEDYKGYLAKFTSIR